MHKKHFMLDPIEEFPIGYIKQLRDTLNNFINEKLNMDLNPTIQYNVKLRRLYNPLLSKRQ